MPRHRRQTRYGLNGINFMGKRSTSVGNHCVACIKKWVKGRWLSPAGKQIDYGCASQLEVHPREIAARDPYYRLSK